MHDSYTKIAAKSQLSYFIENKALFGSYPKHEDVKELENEGVILFVDLTCPGEKKITSLSQLNKIRK